MVIIEHKHRTSASKAVARAGQTAEKRATRLFSNHHSGGHLDRALLLETLFNTDCVHAYALAAREMSSVPLGGEFHESVAGVNGRAATDNLG